MSLWRRLTASRAEQEAAELQLEAQEAHTTPIGDCCAGETVSVSGTVRAVTIRPVSENPALEVELYDGTGRVRIVWLGRHRIPGIEPGRRVTVTGRLTVLSALPTIYNPRYTLRPVSR